MGHSRSQCAPVRRPAAAANGRPADTQPREVPRLALASCHPDEGGTVQVIILAEISAEEGRGRRRMEGSPSLPDRHDHVAVLLALPEPWNAEFGDTFWILQGQSHLVALADAEEIENAACAKADLEALAVILGRH